MRSGSKRRPASAPSLRTMNAAASDSSFSAEITPTAAEETVFILHGESSQSHIFNVLFFYYGERRSLRVYLMKTDV